jgi:hypothetical protein
MVSDKEEREAKRAQAKAARAQAKAAHVDLAQWRSAAEFAARVAQLAEQVPSHKLLRSPEFNFLTEALALAEFLKLHPVDEVRLADLNAQHPDAFVRIGGKVIELEITEALNADRKRGDEYREDAPKLVHVSQEEMIAYRKEIEPAITAAIDKKLNGGNDRAFLLVYVELQIHFDLTPDDEAVIAATKQRFREKFRDIHVVCKGKLY